MLAEVNEEVFEVTNAGVGGTNDALDGEGGGVDVEFFTDLFSNAAKEVRGCEDFRRDEGALGSGEGFEGVFERDEFALLFDFSGQLCDLFFKCFDGVLLSNFRAIYEVSYHGLLKPSRRSIPSVSMARAVGLMMSF